MTSPLILSAEHLSSLAVGDTFESEGIFQGVTDEPVTWKLVKKDKECYLLEASYMGIFLGAFEAVVKKGFGPDKKGFKVEIEEVAYE